MKTKIFADKYRLSLSTPPHGSSVGNKILHLFFILKAASMHNLDPVITTDSNLDLIFDCSGIKHLNLPCPPYLFVEESAYSCNDIRKVAENSREQFFREKAFMETSFDGKPDFSISGHFYHFDLMPSKEEYEKFIKIRPELITNVIKRYPSIINSNAVGVHYRGLDFKRHLSGIFGSIVPDHGYYKRAIEQVERKIHGNIEFHLFSDEPEFLETLFCSLGKKYVTHSGNFFQEDWVGMYLIPNIVCSNSSFCWTACLWNKSIVVQANGGVNYYNSILGAVPYGIHIPNAVLISSKNRVFRNCLLEFKKKITPFLKILRKHVLYFVSQFGQDRWVIEDVFKSGKGKFFLDIGAGDGICFSNTYILERHFGWKGICIEPSAQFDKLACNRRCIYINDCVADEEREVNFTEADMLSCIPEYCSKNSAELVGKNITTRKAKPLEAILKKYNTPEIIDYLNLDTEGSEYLILKDFPFDKYTFLSITVEHNNNSDLKNNLRELLSSNGYVLFCNIGPDDWWVHNSIESSITISSKKYSLAYYQCKTGKQQKITPKFIYELYNLNKEGISFKKVFRLLLCVIMNIRVNL